MKRTVLLVTLFCGFSLMCFAKGNLELFGGMPLTWENASILGIDADMQMTSISAGFGMVAPINDKIAFGVWDEIIFPQKMDMTVAGQKETVERSDYDTLMGMAVTLAPVFNIYSNDKVKIPAHVGIRGSWLISSQKYSNVFGIQFGLEAGIGAEYHINEKIYLFGKVKGIYDFFSFSTITASTYYGTTTVSNSGLISSFGFTPNIGIGIKF
jgi:hypothetical protein